LRNSTQLVAGLGLTAVSGNSLFAGTTKKSQSSFSANETINVALIGCRSMGWTNLTSFLTHKEVRCIALCDVDSKILNDRAAELEKDTGIKPSLYGDYRKLLENKDIDAVIIGTPDHWHCLQMVDACAAGKDIYVEKPIANSIEECNLMVAAKNRYGSIVQVGQWQRSDLHWISALDYLKSGKLGKIRTAKTWAYVNYGRNFPSKPDQTVPQGVDYEMWLGPAPKRPFNPNRFHGNFRYFWEYGGGLMTDWGVHMIDMVLSGMEVSTPGLVSAVGGKYGNPQSAADTPDTLNAVYDFGEFSMLWEQSLGTGREPYNRQSGEPGVAFVGNNGTLVINRNTWEILPEINENKYMVDPRPIQAKPGAWSYGLDHHTRNFLDCIKTRQQPNCTIEMGRNAAINAQIGNISFRLGTALKWDDQKNRFVNNSQADELAKAHYRAPWELPNV